MGTAVYAGRFDPITHGHLSVLRHAVGLFSDVRVVVVDVPGEEALLSAEERADLVRQLTSALAEVRVDVSSRPVAEYAKQVGASALVRGLRDVSEAAAESALAEELRRQLPSMQTVWLPVDPRYSRISSGVLKSLVRRGDLESIPCPPLVLERLRARLDAAGVAAEPGHPSRPAARLRRSSVPAPKATSRPPSLGLESLQESATEAASSSHSPSAPTVFDGVGEG